MVAHAQSRPQRRPSGCHEGRLPRGVVLGAVLLGAVRVGTGVREVRAGRLHLPIAVPVAPHRKQQPRRKRDNGKIRTREAMKTCS